MKVTFKATRELASLSCLATNKVMDDQQVKTSHLKLCFAYKPGTGLQMDPLAASSTVNVRYKPEIVVKGLDIVYIVLGEDFVLNCSYSANPTVTAQVLWYKNGKMLDYRKVMPYGSVIEITGGEEVRLHLAAGLLT